ncbi:MAG: DUF1826 domain-containing protein [Pseudomonadota bacterium]
MSIVRNVVQDAAIGATVTETLEGLSSIGEPACAAAILQRSPEPAFQRWIDAVHPADLPKARLILAPGDIGPAIADLFDAYDVAYCPHSAWLIEDIRSLAVRFNELVPAPFLRLRLDVINTDACRRFHIDPVVARLICTYRGTGTQLGFSADENAPSEIFTVPTGAPVLLRGKLWPGTPPAGLSHRSPPIAGTGEVRLVLVIDPICDPDEELC